MEGKQQNLEIVRMHSFMVVTSLFGNEDEKTPKDMFPFEWELTEEEKAELKKSSKHGLRGMSSEDWAKEVELFNAKTEAIKGGTGYSK